MLSSIKKFFSRGKDQESAHYVFRESHPEYCVRMEEKDCAHGGMMPFGVAVEVGEEGNSFRICWVITPPSPMGALCSDRMSPIFWMGEKAKCALDEARGYIEELRKLNPSDRIGKDKLFPLGWHLHPEYPKNA